jgi:hypothetical protein
VQTPEGTKLYRIIALRSFGSDAEFVENGQIGATSSASIKPLALGRIAKKSNNYIFHIPCAKLVADLSREHLVLADRRVR